MNLENVPKDVTHLASIVEEWGINDDGYRDQNIECSSTQVLEHFIQSISERDLILVNYWLSNESEIVKSSNEYINYTCFIMAYDYARAVLKSRNNQISI